MKKTKNNSEKRKRNEQTVFWGLMFGLLVAIIAWSLWFYYHLSSSYQGYYVFMIVWGCVHFYFHIIDKQSYIIKQKYIIRKKLNGLDPIRLFGIGYLLLSAISLIIGISF